ncbi:conserved hypothetical protein [Candidatus Roizmanbacteria bacterium]|nr:conserved hypothetical protein [Candidatus Roizmanbacteria bacterium]
MENIYKTKDLAEAGALILKEQGLERIEREGKVCWFIFTNKIECQKLSNQFFFGNLQANLREYHEILSRLKSRIFSY